MTSNNKTFLSNFVTIGPLVQKVKGEEIYFQLVGQVAHRITEVLLLEKTGSLLNVYKTSRHILIPQSLNQDLHRFCGSFLEQQVC